MIPAIRTLISIPAGLARMPFGTFVTTTFIGAYAWCTLLIGAGYLLGHEWELISLYLKQALPYLLVGALLLVTRMPQLGIGAALKTVKVQWAGVLGTNISASSTPSVITSSRVCWVALRVNRT